MSTEDWSPRSRGLDTWPAAEIARHLLEGQAAAAAVALNQASAIGAIADALAERLSTGGRLAYAGAGTSGRLAVQDGAELTPTFGWPADRLVFLMAGGEAALLRAQEGAEDDREAAAASVGEAGLGPGDALIAVSASGATPYTLAAAETARRAGALTVGIANVPASVLLHAVELPLALATGAEAIAGSTRMMAGTAQRIALTVLSSTVMARLGGVHDGLMVGVEATNTKLVKRSRLLVERLAGVDGDAAVTALQAAGGRVKPAVLIARGVPPDRATALLAAAAGSLRRALDEAG